MSDFDYLPPLPYDQRQVPLLRSSASYHLSSADSPAEQKDVYYVDGADLNGLSFYATPADMRKVIAVLLAQVEHREQQYAARERERLAPIAQAISEYATADLGGES